MTKDIELKYPGLIAANLTKGQLTKIRIVDGTIKVFAKHGPAGATFNLIAKASGVSRPLISHYFTSKEEIFGFAGQYVRTNLEEYVTERMVEKMDAKMRLRIFSTSVFSWVEERPFYYQFWLQYYLNSDKDNNGYDSNFALAQAGREKVKEIIDLGIESGQFSCDNSELTARVILSSITGVCSAIATEDFVKSKKNDFIEEVLNTFWSHLKKRRAKKK